MFIVFQRQQVPRYLSSPSQSSLLSWWVQQVVPFLYLTAKRPATLFCFCTLYTLPTNYPVANLCAIKRFFNTLMRKPYARFKFDRHSGGTLVGTHCIELLLLCLQGYRVRKGWRIWCELSITISENSIIFDEIIDKLHPQLPRDDSKHCSCSAPACSCLVVRHLHCSLVMLFYWTVFQWTTIYCWLLLVVASALTSANVSLSSGTRSPDETDGAAGSVTHSVFVRLTSNFVHLHPLSLLQELGMSRFSLIRYFSPKFQREPEFVFSLSSHRHSYIGPLFSSRFIAY